MLMQVILEAHTRLVVDFIKTEYNITKAIQLPWIGCIVENNCKGLRYNNGLYTQCNVTCNNLCSYCKKNRYGTVYDREKQVLGGYRDPNGRLEINYMSYLKKHNISVKDVERECERVWGIKLPEEYTVVKRRGRPKKIQEVNDTDSDTEKKTRGRPRKYKKIIEIKNDLVDALVDSQEEEDIVDCTEFRWENIIYWKDSEGNLFNSKTKNHCGIYDTDNNIVTLYQ
tara:strand:- start:420 stop:1097 length:678 start_codon:yes stop_codon:yes gene_type:complete